MRAPLLLVACLLLTALPAEATHLPWPNDMAALGDSITRAANVGGLQLGDWPRHSWSTGYDSADGISSHYERILAKNSAIKDKNFNDAVSGATMSDLAAQADKAVTQGADHVTILMGANDVCDKTVAGMTPVDTFRTQFRAGADRLKAGLPNAVVYVVSIPDIYILWKIYDGHTGAERAWANLDICQNLLSNSATEADRQAVRQRNIEYNQVLEQEAAAYGFHWDGWAAFNYQFVRSDVSTLDYFHPSKAGQANIATVTWNAGPYSK